MNNYFKLSILTFACVVLIGSAFAGDSDKKVEKQTAEVSTIELTTHGGGCAGNGAFCCIGHENSCKNALEKVSGVTKVTVDHENQLIQIDYENGQLNLSELSEAAKNIGHDLILQ